MSTLNSVNCWKIFRLNICQVIAETVISVMWVQHDNAAINFLIFWYTKVAVILCRSIWPFMKYWGATEVLQYCVSTWRKVTCTVYGRESHTALSTHSTCECFVMDVKYILSYCCWQGGRDLIKIFHYEFSIFRRFIPVVCVQQCQLKI